MSEYRKKPVVISAWQWNPGDMEDAGAVLGTLMAHGAEFACEDGLGDETTLGIVTLEGTMTAKPGDWIIRGIAGEFYPCAAEIFAASYEPAGAPAAPEIDVDDLALALAAVEDAPSGGTTPERYSAWCRVRRAVEIAQAKVASHG